MNRKLIIVFIFVLFLFLSNKKVLAIVDPLSVPNNKFGIHILEPSEIDRASDLVNSSGGDWGYVTIPIRADDRYKQKWQAFFDKCRELHLIPILRLATYVRENYWIRPTEFTLLDFANFLSELKWPIKNKYVVFFNEPNYALEWGGVIDPEGYAKKLVLGAIIFKKKDEDFFILSAGLDAAAPNDRAHMEEYRFLNRMYQAEPGVFDYLDGWTSHSYPNPGFSGRPTDTHRRSIVSYKHEVNFLRRFGIRKALPIYITETGWNMGPGLESVKAQYLKQAYSEVWKDDSLTAVTPFLLFAGDGSFVNFSMIKKDGSITKSYKEIKQIAKNAGFPLLEEFNVLGAKNSLSFKSWALILPKNDSLISKIRSPKFRLFLSSLKKILASKEGTG